MSYERPYTGLTAEVKVGGVPLAYMSGLDLNLEKDIIEVLQFGARFKEKVPAIKDWSATVDGTVALAPGGSQKKLFDAFNNDEEITLGIFLNEFVYFEGKAYVTNFNINGAPDDKMNLSCDLEGNGAVLLTLPDTYRITVNSGVGGTATPGGAIMVASNGNQQITIAPAPNYVIDAVEDNGLDKTTTVVANIYTVSNVNEDHIIHVTFRKGTTTDKSALRLAITFAESLEQGSYSDDSWEAVTAALNAATTTEANENATQTQVNSANTALRNAICDLEEAAS